MILMILNVRIHMHDVLQIKILIQVMYILFQNKKN